MAFAVAAVALLVGIVVMAKSGLAIGGFAISQDLNQVSVPIIENIFLMGNWNLFFFFGLCIMAVAWRSLLDGVHAVITVVVAAGCVFLAAVFYFRIAQYVTDFTTINRAVVHFVPVLVFYFATLAWARIYQTPQTQNATQEEYAEFYRGRLQAADTPNR